MNKKTTTTTVTVTGVFILLTAFGYSWLTTVSGRTEYVAADESEQVVREVMPGMTDGSMGMMGYQDGTYTAAVKYEVPYGYIEPMTLAVTIADGVITESTADFEVVNPVSGDYIQLFDRYHEDKVVGKPVAEVSLARVGGATLTNVAFDAALKKIKAEATGNTLDTDSKETVVQMTLPEITFGRPEDAIPVGPSENRIQLVQGPLPTPSALIGQTPKDTSSSVYADGVYVVEQEYYAWPNLFEPMQTTITLVDGIIVDAVQKYSTIDYSHSIQYQRHFDSLYKDVVIGMPIDDAPIARVGQATETTDGFNDALEAIKAEARKS